MIIQKINGYWLIDGHFPEHYAHADLCEIVKALAEQCGEHQQARFCNGFYRHGHVAAGKELTPHASRAVEAEGL